MHQRVDDAQLIVAGSTLETKKQTILADLEYWTKKLDTMEKVGNIDGIKVCRMMLDHYLDKLNEQSSL